MEDRFATNNVLCLLNRRSLGLPLNENGRSVRHSRSNYRCDFRILKCILADKDIYLEVIAGKQIPRANAPSFYHNRLFTNNYRTWFNLCTSPTSGPSLMMHDLFNPDATRVNPLHSRPRIVDAVSMDPPNGCVPKPNSQHLPCILLLTKDGWIYQFSINDARRLNRICIRTRLFADNVTVSKSRTSDKEDIFNKELHQARERISSIVFNYQYISTDEEMGEVLVKSTASVQGQIFKAYVILGVFPLRVINHFVTVSNTSDLEIDLMNDMLVLTKKTGSKVTFYGRKDILSKFSINDGDLQICQPMLFSESNTYIRGSVGDASIGLPFMSNPLFLDDFEEWSDLSLFSTKATKHLVQIGGVPYHYAVPVDSNCTTWSMRSLVNNIEVLKFHVDQKWDDSHTAGFRFHPDNSGRILVVNKRTATVYHFSTKPQGNDSGKAKVFGSCQHGRKVVYIFGVPAVSNQSRECAAKLELGVKKSYEIQINRPEECQLLTPRSSYGRTLKNPRRLSSSQLTGSELGVLAMSYENELDVIAVLHLEASALRQNNPSPDALFNLVVSIYENEDGKKINSVCVEQDLHASDSMEVDITIDEDTLIYTRTEMPNLLNYRIMRFCRKR